MRCWRRTLGGLQTPALVRFLVRMALACALAGVAAWSVEQALSGLGEEPGILLSLLRGGLAGLAGGLVLLLAARLMRIREVTSLVDSVAGRLAAAVSPTMCSSTAQPEAIGSEVSDA